ncbi:hypothetical protein OG339_14210 [Streptosporangium sp. NBC_01495]|uniref:hypothetical protein n=1 Tax=Streptosporangium sp. NBC_01495 TaxID=2903899 RepID=UPI002E30D2E7|nr:hypothetical protein [Streptosporangium sp. NBC_01495]
MRPEDVFFFRNGEESPFTERLNPYLISKEMNDSIDDIAEECRTKKVEVIRFALTYALANANWEDLANMKQEFRELAKVR